VYRWHNSAGEQGHADVDVEGRLALEVDDFYYSGCLTRQDSVALAHAILDCDTMPRPTPTIRRYRVEVLSADAPYGVPNPRVQLELAYDAADAVTQVELTIAKSSRVYLVAPWDAPERPWPPPESKPMDDESWSPRVRALTPEDVERFRECLRWLHAQPSIDNPDVYRARLDEARQRWPDVATLIGF